MRYGPSADETLDLIVPSPGAPLVVFFHGGYWRRLAKEDATYVASGFAPHGIATAIVNYGLAPAVPLEEIVAQARRSVAWLRAHAHEYGADAAAPVVAGHSAGGHLAAMCAVDEPVHAVATISGLHDLRPLVGGFTQPWLALDDRRAAELSPALLTPAAPCTLHVSYGVREGPGFAAQGSALADAWSAWGCPVTTLCAEDDDHFTVASRLVDPADPLTRAIAGLVARS